MSEPAIELQSVGFRYGGRPALSEIQLTVPAGAWYVCLGLNGAGKSTLLRLIAGRLRPSEGRCRLFGAPPKSASARARFFFQASDEAPLPHTTVRELVDFDLGLFARPRLSAEGRSALLARFGLTGLERRPLTALSRGQLRRAELAALRAVDPDLWLLDEPHAGLDAEGQSLFVEECVQARARGRTLVVASHSFLELAAAPDRILVLRHGRLAWQGSPEAMAERLRAWNWSVSAPSRGFEPSLRAWAETAEVELIGPTAPTAAQILDLLRLEGE